MSFAWQGSIADSAAHHSRPKTVGNVICDLVKACTKAAEILSHAVMQCQLATDDRRQVRSYSLRLKHLHDNDHRVLSAFSWRVYSYTVAHRDCALQRPGVALLRGRAQVRHVRRLKLRGVVQVAELIGAARAVRLRGDVDDVLRHRLVVPELPHLRAGKGKHDAQ